MTLLDEPARVLPAAQVETPAPIGRPGRGLWWIAPIGTLALVVPLSLYVSLNISDRDYRLFYGAPKAITNSDAFDFAACALVLALGTMLPLAFRDQRFSRRWPGLDADAGVLDVLRRGATVCFRVTVFGYLALGAAGIARGARPSTIIDTITSQNDYTGQLKTLFAPVTGVTSFTQVGIAYVVLAMVLRGYEKSKRTDRRLMIVLVLGLARAYLLTERLALLELVVPMVAISAMRARQRSRRRWLLPALPVLALPLLLVVFGAFEYSRSWVYYRSRTTLSFPAFIVNRLAGYYATSYNNGALTLKYGRLPGRLPYDSIQGFWTSPGLSQLGLYHRLTGMNGDDIFNNVLAQHGNPEFNNPGGLAVPIFDFGLPGALVFFALAGLVIGFAYRSFRAGNPLGVLLYPVLFTGVLELPRYIYWTEGRVVSAYLALLIIGLRAGWVARRGRRLAAAP